jgi:hypothetical protein
MRPDIRSPVQGKLACIPVGDIVHVQDHLIENASRLYGNAMCVQKSQKAVRARLSVSVRQDADHNVDPLALGGRALN